MTAGRRWPAEWEPQAGVLLTWPHAASDWGADLARVETVYRALAAAITAHERLLIVYRDDDHRKHIRGQLPTAPAHPVMFGRADNNDTWARDHGPLCIEADGACVICDFQFDGWGGKYPAAADNAITARLHAQGLFGNAALETMDWVLEGGAVDGDGDGTVLTTESCLLGGHRNPGLDRAALERRLASSLGIRRVLWLGHGQLQGDDTDGHVDTLARFCATDTIAYTACDDQADEHYADLRAMETQLAALRRPDGAPYRLVPLPLPAALVDAEGHRLPATYANFLIINGAVLLPSYDNPMDHIAHQRLQSCFPHHRIIPIDCRPLIEQYGSLHCVTMQLPALCPLPV